jgi:hypothetical protein
MGPHLRRWGPELSGSVLLTYFLFNGVLYDMCVHFRPRAPEPLCGWVVPVTTKFVTCYTSQFESAVQQHFIAIGASLFLVAFALKATYPWSLGLQSQCRPSGEGPELP